MEKKTLSKGLVKYIVGLFDHLLIPTDTGSLSGNVMNQCISDTMPLGAPRSSATFRETDCSH